MPRRFLFALLVLILLSTASACNFLTNQSTTPSPPRQPPNPAFESFPIDPLFEEFYAYLGGEPVLGPPISRLIESGNVKSQYVESAQLLFDPLAAPSDRFHLAPLGLMLGVAEPPVPEPGLPGSRYINGHTIYDEFLPFYDELGGARFVGRPLTEARHNPEKHRIEQYFENLGMYRLDDEPPGSAHLLAYGAIACPQGCRSQPPPSGVPGLRPILPAPFSTSASRLGLDITGLTLSEPYRSPDGEIEVIFENLVLVLDLVEEAPPAVVFRLWLPKIKSASRPVQDREYAINLWLPITVTVISGDRVSARLEMARPLWLPLVFSRPEALLQGVHLRPIVQMLGFEPQPPVPPSEDPLMVFYPTEGSRGHNVPLLFDAFLKRLGGISVSGPPISEVFPLSDGVFRQCFSNLCLDFDTNAPDNEQLAPARLGAEYKEKYYLPPGSLPESGELGYLNMTVSRAHRYVTSDQSQEVQVVVSENGMPLANREPVLSLTLPDGSQQVFKMEPTDAEGQTRLLLPPVAAPSFTLIRYQVCLVDREGEQLCLEDQYPIINSE